MGDGIVNEPLSATLDALVVALCADYERRESLINSRTLPSRVECEYRYLNAKIRLAAEEAVGEFYSTTFIDDVGRRIGYAKTELGFMCEKSYKVKKLALKRSIAKRLHLI